MSMWFIYIIENIINGKIYVGQTKNPDERKRYHLFKNNSNCRVLANAIKKYGPENFDFVLLEACPSEEEADTREIYWIEVLNTLRPHGYNLKSGGQGGGRHSEETKKIISMKRTGKTGYKHTDKTKQKISESHKGSKNPFFGRKHTEETCVKISEAITGERNPFYGKKHSEETKNIIREKAKKENLSEVTLNKMRTAQLGKIIPAEVRAKMSTSHKAQNRILSPEEKKKMEEGKLVFWEKVRVGEITNPWNVNRRRTQSEFMKERWKKRREIDNGNS